VQNNRYLGVEDWKMRCFRVKVIFSFKRSTADLSGPERMNS